MAQVTTGVLAEMGETAARQTAPQNSISTLTTRVLLVEDNEVNRLLLTDYLEYCGYKILALADGSYFFETLEKFQPHLILLDLKLPGIDGYTLLQQLQHLPESLRVPVVVISAFAFAAERQRALGLGASHYLVKPINLSQLYQVIREELCL